MNVDFAVLADGAGQRPDGKMDIYGAGVDTLHATAVPVGHPRLAIVMRLLLSTDEIDQPHRLEAVLTAADGTEIARAEGSVPPLSSEQREALDLSRPFGIAVTFSFENLVFPNFGPYAFVIRWDGVEVREPLPLYVVQVVQA
jgi:hypothetical protein